MVILLQVMFALLRIHTLGLSENLPLGCAHCCPLLLLSACQHDQGGAHIPRADDAFGVTLVKCLKKGHGCTCALCD